MLRQTRQFLTLLMHLNIWVMFNCRASLGWFAHQPEWYDMNKNFALSEAQSVTMFVHHLLNEQLDTPQLDSRGRALENGSSLNDVVR